MQFGWFEKKHKNFKSLRNKSKIKINVGSELTKYYSLNTDKPILLGVYEIYSLS